MCSSGFYWVFTRFYKVLLGFIGFYWVLPGFTRFYWVLLGVTLFALCGAKKLKRAIQTKEVASLRRPTPVSIEFTPGVGLPGLARASLVARHVIGLFLGQFLCVWVCVFFVSRASISRFHFNTTVAMPLSRDIRRDSPA